MTDSTIDKAGSVREGEELPIAPLKEWLNSNIGDLNGNMKVTQYSGGASNWTYCLGFETR